MSDVYLPTRIRSTFRCNGSKLCSPTRTSDSARGAGCRFCPDRDTESTGSAVPRVRCPGGGHVRPRACGSCPTLVETAQIGVHLRRSAAADAPERRPPVKPVRPFGQIGQASTGSRIETRHICPRDGQTTPPQARLVEDARLVGRNDRWTGCGGADGAGRRRAAGRGGGAGRGRATGRTAGVRAARAGLTERTGGRLAPRRSRARSCLGRQCGRQRRRRAIGGTWPRDPG